MSHKLLRSCALMLSISVFGISPAYADIECEPPKMSVLEFGDVNPQSTQTDSTATFNVKCRNTAIGRWSATFCLSIEQPRQMKNKSAPLNFQLYQDPARSIIWGSQFGASAAAFQFDRTFSGGSTIEFPITMFGRVLKNQTTAVPALYSQVFAAGDTRLTINRRLGANPPDSCNTSPGADRRFPFTVSANVVKKCTVTANPLDFGTNPGLLNTAVNASTTIDVQCSNTTPYNVSLSAGQNAGGDINARKMLLGSNSVGYQLYRDSARTQVWGITEGSDTAPGIGNGTTTDSLTVYGTVPVQTTPPAGIYKDTVVVTVTY